MAKAHYTDYVAHCMRLYTRHPKPSFPKAEMLNWESCENVLTQNFTPSEQKILTDVYYEQDTLADNVYCISRERKIKQKKIWALIKRLEFLIAKDRGLI